MMGRDENLKHTYVQYICIAVLQTSGSFEDIRLVVVGRAIADVGEGDEVHFQLSSRYPHVTILTNGDNFRFFL